MAAGFASGLYLGTVTHRRLRPRPHALRYSMASMLVDLDELPVLHQRLRLFAHNRFNLFAFFDRDFGDGSGIALRTQVERHLAEAGISLEGGAIRLLCLPRMLGYAFNPLSVYFCYRGKGLAAILYEVSNTFGERHSYLIPVETDDGRVVRQSCPKNFYVSPFMDMDQTYDFRILPPGERLAVSVQGSDAEGLILSAAFAGRRTALSGAALLRVALLYPLMTLKVIAGIHWEALKLWLKGVKLRVRPPAPAEPVTIVRKAP